MNKNLPINSSKAFDVSIIVPCYNEGSNIKAMVQALDKALHGWRWEVIFVDDNSPDRSIEIIREIAKEDFRVRGLLRFDRRGLSSAVIEGVLASSAECIAVIDGDMQHDETRLPELLKAIIKENYDFAVGSRHVEGGNNIGLANRWRHILSDSGIWLSQRFLPVTLSDPMSGFFAMRRKTFVELVPQLSGTGFKILLDLVMSSPKTIRLKEIPCDFRPRLNGESKLDFKVMIQFLIMLCEKLCHGYFPTRLLTSFFIIIAGIVVNLIIALIGQKLGCRFFIAQWIGAVGAILGYFWLGSRFFYCAHKNKIKKTLRYNVFLLLCLVGSLANLWLGNLTFNASYSWAVASFIGSGFGMMWNNIIATQLVWRS